MKFSKEMLRLYAVTDRNWVGEQTLAQQVEAAIRGGATIVQLREKSLSRDAFLAEAKKISVLCRRYQIPFLINDNVDIALEAGADGVHVGIEDTPVAEIRRRAPSEFIIGATCKTVEQARQAEAAGADYMGVGAVFPSPTKKNAVRITAAQLHEICTSVSIPAVAIGGIDGSNLAQLRGVGMAGIAVVSALFGAADIEAAAAALLRQIKAILE